MQELSDVVKNSYPINEEMLNKIISKGIEINAKYSKRITSSFPENLIWKLLEWHMKNYANCIKPDKSQLVYIGGFMDFKRRIIEKLIDTHKIFIKTPFVMYDKRIVNYLRVQWEQAYPAMDKANRKLYAAACAYKFGVNIKITHVDANLPFIEMVAVRKDKLKDIYGVYLNGCIGKRRVKNV